MTVISISIIESTQQIISGIPKSLTLSTNIVASIFYTFDGTIPTTDSFIYTGSVTLPTNTSSVIFSAFATDGIDSSAVITKTYSPSVLGARFPHDTVLDLGAAGPSAPDNFPFGGFSPTIPTPYGKSGGINISDPALPIISDGYDGAGNSAGGTNLPLSSYTNIYSTTDSEGQTGRGIGTLPAQVTIKIPIPTSPSSSSNMSDKFFNPKAMVIYQDSREPPIDDVTQLNHQFFSLSDIERSRNGGILLNTAFDSSASTGSFLRSHFNPRDNTITYHYRDKDTNQWIISKEPFSPRNSSAGALHTMVFSRSTESSGVGYFYKWVPFMSRKLI